MFEWLFGKKENKKEEETKKSFSNVKRDMDEIVKWIKHLDSQDKRLFDELSTLKQDLSTVMEDLAGLREGIEIVNDGQEEQQLFEKTTVRGKQTTDLDVENDSQTTVQTGNFYEILKGLSGNERLLIMTLANSDMKLSYEDLALLLGKERSTIRGQINSIKQKSEGLIEEISEKNGKKRVFVPSEIKEKLAKYAKVRVKKE